jgi:nucleotide-binding universal stress UspA family protein
LNTKIEDKMMENINHILLAADGSEGSREAALLTKDLAAACGAKISVITVNDEDALSLPAMIEAALPDTTPYSPFPKSDMRKIIEQHAEQEILARLNAMDEKAYTIGEIAERKKTEEKIVWK